jgi:dual-specificity kinase
VFYQLLSFSTCFPTFSLIFMSADRITAKMGEGTFGQVLECWDRECKEMVAIKIIRGIKKYRDAAMIEIGMLEQLCKYEKSRSR